ncbi:MAG: HAD family hydrolase [Treponema sp.]|jgi:2-haloacid dehalogenase/putative hydrolase of the HAD superfamily|nr:HAD family hydrolase [Treponema sp.]
MIKAVFLDFYGTLVEEDDKIVSSIVENVVSNSKSNIINYNDAGQFWRKEFISLCNTCNGKNFKLQKEIEYISLTNTITRFESNINIENELKKMFEYWEKPAIFPDSIFFLEKIQFPVIIVSNIDRNEIIEAIDYNKIDLNNVITSEDTLYYKPNENMFKMAMEKNNLKANEIIHIGDSLSSDILGANNVNIKSIWLNRKGNENKSNAIPNITANDFYEVIEKIINGKIIQDK